MSDSTNHNVVGNDGIKPSYAPEGLWQIWSIDQIYRGENGRGLHVPKVKDHVVEPLTGTTYYVKSLSERLIPELELLSGTNSVTMNSTDLLFSVGPGVASQNYRLYYDETVFPYRLDVSAFLTIRSVQAAYAVAYYGPIQGNSEPISFVMDASGALASNRVPLETLPPPSGDYANYRFKSVAPFYTNKRLVNGDQVTLGLYSVSHHLVGHTVLTVTESGHMRPSNAAVKYITHIGVRSPFLADYDPSILELPMGWNKGSMNITGQVHYSDGTVVEHNIDGRRMALNGIDQVLASIPDHFMDLNLVYFVPEGEVSIHESSVNSRTVNFPMRVKVTQAQNSYSAKLYAIPTWNGSNSVYRLRWLMLNLERNMYYDVTDHVRPAANSPLFDGLLYGELQRFQVTLNLRDVFPTYKPYIHTQVVEVSLYGRPSDFESPWSIRQAVTDPRLYRNVYAKIVDSDSISIANNLSDQADWLERLYENSQPLSEYPDIPNVYPSPTHFIVQIGNQNLEFPISYWNRSIRVGTNFQPHDTINVIFVRQTTTAKLYLSFAPMILQS